MSTPNHETGLLCCHFPCKSNASTEEKGIDETIPRNVKVVPIKLNLMLKDGRMSCVLISAFVFSVAAHKPNGFLYSCSATARLHWI